MRMSALLFVVFACSSSPPSAVQPTVEPAPVQAVQPPSASAAELYAECREAVEGPTEAGECSADADCEAVGCSGEMCVTKEVAAAGIMSPCVERPCHAVLDTCGCVEGTCRWSLKSP